MQILPPLPVARGFILAVTGLAFLPFRTSAAEPPEPLQTASLGVAAALPASVDLRPMFDKWGLARRQQGKRGTCSVFTVAGALEFAAAHKLERGERFSVEFLNWGSNKIVGEDVDGSMFSDLWRAFAEYGVCLETNMPYRSRFDPTLAPTPEALAEAKTRLALGVQHHWIKPWDVRTGLTDKQFVEIQRTLNNGWPVCAGLRWPKQAKWTDGILEMCPADAVFDGHSILLVGCREDTNQLGGGVFIFRNTANGGRDGYMPYTYARTYMNDAIWFETQAPARPAGQTSSEPALPPVFGGPLGAIAAPFVGRNRRISSNVHVDGETVPSLQGTVSEQRTIWLQ
jgi:hypothetical protein